MPKSMLPEEIEKTLKRLGSDGDAVRGTLERDFAAYTKQAAKSRAQLRTLLALAVVRPLLFGGSKAAARWLFSSGEADGFNERLAAVRERLEQATGQKPGGDVPSGDVPSGDVPAPKPGQSSPKSGSLRDDDEDVSGA